MTITLRVAKQALKFSAAHFLIFRDGSAERLHGHNYQVRAELEASRSEDGLVLDFRRLKRLLRRQVEELDEYFLVPALHPEVEVSTRADGITEVRYRERYYAAPSGEVRALPIRNTSSEELARYLGVALADDLKQLGDTRGLRGLTLSVEETPGQEARVHLSLDSRRDTRGPGERPRVSLTQDPSR